MADSSFEKGLAELSKMKVADLKTELKQRGLPTAGNKNELIERLQLAIQDSSLSLDETNEEILDEDAVLGDEEIEELSTKTDQQSDENEKIESPVKEDSSSKKLALNNKSVPVEEKKIAEIEKKEEKREEKTEENGEPKNKVIKLSQLSVKERLEMRAKKFGLPLSDTAKKEARLERFNSNGTSDDDTKNKKSNSIDTQVTTSLEVLKKRAERFGTSASTLMEKAELQEKIEKRKARFGEVKPVRELPNKVKIVK